MTVPVTAASEHGATGAWPEIERWTADNAESLSAATRK